jgi:hypothetical protein
MPKKHFQFSNFPRDDSRAFDAQQCTSTGSYVPAAAISISLAPMTIIIITWLGKLTQYKKNKNKKGFELPTWVIWLASCSAPLSLPPGEEKRRWGERVKIGGDVPILYTRSSDYAYDNDIIVIDLGGDMFLPLPRTGMVYCDPSKS